MSRHPNQYCSWCKDKLVKFTEPPKTGSFFLSCDECSNLIKKTKKQEEIVDVLVKAGRIEVIRGDMPLEIVKG